MDFQRLENFRYLKKAVERCRLQIEEMCASIGSLPGVMLGGVPGGGNMLSVEERTIERLEQLRMIYAYRLERYLAEKVEVEEFINGIDDVLIQQIFILRFVEGYKWFRVAMEIGGGNTEDSVRMACKRYLEVINTHEGE